MNINIKNLAYGVLGIAMVGGGVMWLGSENSTTSDTSNAYSRDDNFNTERSYEEYGDYDCSDFSTWSSAQEFFEDEGGPSDDYHNLDRDGDGIACEGLK